MNDTITSETHNGYTVEIWTDTDAENPRSWDNLGTMVCFHDRYNLGDTTKYKHNFTEIEDFKAFLERPDVISLPLYLYDHSGITMSTTGFSCPWDSGQVGAIYATKETIRKELSRPRKLRRGQKNPDLLPIKRVTKKDMARVLLTLKEEVKTYDRYLTGNVYGYTVTDSDGDVIDSCGGFFGDVEDVHKEALCVVDNVRPYQLPLPSMEVYCY